MKKRPKQKMKSRLLLGLIISALFLSNGSSLIIPAYSETGSSTSFQIDGSSIKSVGETKTSTSFSVDDQITDIETSGSSTTFISEPPLSTINNCGNGIKDPGEECDTNDFGSSSCITYGFNSGTLICSASCTILTTNCSNLPGGGGGSSGGGLGIFPNRDDEDEEEAPEPQEDQEQEEQEDKQPEPEEAVIPAEEETTTPVTPQVTVAKEPELKQPEEATPKIQEDDFHILKDKIQITNITELSTPTTPERPALPTDPGIKQTIDQTPVISGKLQNNQTYTVQIFDNNNNLLTENEIKTNDQGIFIFEPETTLNLGLTLFKITSPETEGSKPFSTYSIDIISNGYEDLKINTFGPESDIPINISEPVDLGAIIKEDNALLITGNATPNSQIFAYFETDITIEQTKVEKNGFFEILIPKTLDFGNHKVTLIQVYQDGTISNDFVYLFKLISPPNYEYQSTKTLEPKDLLTQTEPTSVNIIYTILSAIVVVLILAIYHLSMRKFVDKKHKRKKTTKQTKKTSLKPKKK